jgi:Outer membrane protein beta-barrel domain
LQSNESSSRGFRPSRRFAFPRRAPLAGVFAFAVGLGVFALAERAHALGGLTLSGSLRGLYGAPIDDLELNPYGGGVGLRAGLTLPSSLYLGGSFDYFFGESIETPPVGELSISVLQLMGHVGYDIGLGPFMLRPGVGLGLSNFNSDAGGDTDTEGDFVASPGVEAAFNLVLLSFGAELRYNKVFADGDNVDALTFGIGIGIVL